ncbi:hypothetical protein tb265_34180 [Gemmatimonadetes bacterium T265]|nr:hypothetical protein tb265_34180 [Gemmatimonadetes bacterium T265]
MHETWPPPLRRARALILAYGWNTTAYQLLNPGIALWFSDAGDALVGYATHARVRVVAGAPVCAPERLAAVVAEFEGDALRDGNGVCYFGAEGRLEALLHVSPAHARVCLGAQPVWHPEGLSATLHGRGSLRAQLNRARNKGVTVAERPAASICDDPALRRVLRQWLATRGLPTLHFLVEPETFARLGDRRVFVAERGGEAVGFLVLTPVPARNGWLTEQFVRGTAAPNGTIEMLLASAAAAVAAEQAQYFTLGLAPLSRRGSPPPDAGVPLWLWLALRWVRAHGRRFYDFDGLDAFKAKFRPERWEPVYAIAGGRAFPPRALYAIAGVFGGRAPAGLVAAAVVRGARTEYGRWRERRARRAAANGTDAAPR